MTGVSSFEEPESQGKVRFSGDKRPLAQPAPAATKPFQMVIQPAITFAD